MDKKVVGARLAHLRNSFGLSQQELADRLNLKGRGRIGNYETGENYPPFELVEDMCELYGVDVFAVLTAKSGPEIVGEDRTRRLPGHLSFAILRGFNKQAGGQAAIFPEDVLRRRMPGADLDALRWVVNPTDAMSPRYLEGATAFVDPRVNSLDRIVDGQAYALHVFGRADIRRIFILGPNEFRLTGDNPNERRLDLTGPDYKKLEIYGRVIDAI